MRHGWSIKDIFFYLLIFVVGGLIVTFLVSHESFDNFKRNTKEIISSLSSRLEGDTLASNQRYIEVKEYDNELLNKQFGYKCHLLEEESAYLGKGESFRKVTECTSWCGKKSLEYHHYECVTDRLHCYCEF